jgi:hypothetical protein
MKQPLIALGMRNLLVALLLASPVLGLAQDVEAYVKLRAEHRVNALTSLDLVPIVRHGSVIELAGKLTGVSAGGAGTVLTLEDGGYYVVLRAASLPEWVRVGSELQVLAQVDAEGRIGAPDLHLVGVVNRPMLRAHEEQLRREAAAKARLSARKKAPPSRDSTSPATTIAAQINQHLASYAAYVKAVNPKLTDADAIDIARHVLTFSAQYGVDSRLVVAVIVVESGFHPTATSQKGAQGLGQLMPGTAKWMGVNNAYDPQQNVKGTVKLLREHLLRYKDPGKQYVDMRALATALAAYNAGIGAVAKHGGIPPYRETEAYIQKVIGLYQRLCGG